MKKTWYEIVANSILLLMSFGKKAHSPGYSFEICPCWKIFGARVTVELMATQQRNNSYYGYLFLQAVSQVNDISGKGSMIIRKDG